MCEVFTDDGRWPDKELPVLSGCAADDETGMAFLINPDNQYLADDGTWHQLITEKSQIPICLRNKSVYEDGKNDEKELKDVSDDVYKMSFRQKQYEAIEKAKQSEIWNKLIWIVSIGCGTVLIIAAMNYF